MTENTQGSPSGEHNKVLTDTIDPEIAKVLAQREKGSPTERPSNTRNRDGSKIGFDF